MVEQEERPTPDSPQRSADRLVESLREQQQRLADWSDGQDAPPLEELLAEIDVAHEELRAAQEELLAHQVRIDGLLSARAAPTAWRQRLFESLPVPTLLTDPAGLVVALNAPARTLLESDGERVLAGPVTGLLRERDHPVVRDLLAAAAKGRTGRATLEVQTVAGWVPTTAVVGSAGPAGDPDPAGPGGATVTWVLAPGATAAEPARDRELLAAEAFAEMSRLPLTPGADHRTVLARAALLVERALPASDGVSITYGSPVDPESQATDNAFAQAVDGAQHRAQQGPCVQAYVTGRTQVCEHLGTDTRWPELAVLSVPTGVAAVLAVPIRQGDRTIGVLNLYARRRDAFDVRDREVAHQLVTAVRAVVQEVRDRQELAATADQLREALSSRAVIDQAKGILMARGGYDADHAFAQLVAASRRTNIKLREVARLVVDDASDGPATASP